MFENKNYCSGAKRFDSANAETIKLHCAALQALFDEYKINADRIWNLDETGVTPGRDVKGTAREKLFMSSDGQHEAVVPEFAYQNRITIKQVVNAAGVVGPSVYVFKGPKCTTLVFYFITSLIVPRTVFQTCISEYLEINYRDCRL